MSSRHHTRLSLVGRDDELRALRAALHDQGQLLITLIGPGGCGKTRLALAVAEAEAERYPGGMWLVELAPLADPALVPQVVGATLGLREQSDRPLTDALADAIADQRLLLLLDNCEHLVGACTELVDRLLERCPRLHVLATSRAVLGVVGERTWQIPPLSPPHAVQLFAERAAAARRTFVLSDDNAAAVQELCRRLDGLPLAIELVAAQTRVLGVWEIANRLDRVLDTTSPAAGRQRSLRATIDWSFLMLSTAEQAVFARLAVFAGGWSVPAAEAVCGADLDTLTRLVDTSLVTVVEQRGTARHYLLDVIRQYAAERLAATNESADVAPQHAAFFGQLAEQAAAALTDHDPLRWMATLEADHDNLRSALTWLVERAPEPALRMAGALWWFWFRCGLWREGRRWLERVLAATETAGQTASRARALLGLGVLAWAQGDPPLAQASLTQSLALLRGTGNTLDLGLALQFLAMDVLGEGDLPRAARLVEESVNLLRQTGRPVALAMALASRGVVSLAEADYEAARAPLEESVALLRAAHDDWALALPLRNLGIVAFRSGRVDAAAALLRDSLRALHDQRDPWFMSRSLETLAVVNAAQGQHARAARLFGAGEALRASVGAVVLPFYGADYDRALVATRAALGEAAYMQAWQNGRGMRLDDVLAFALAAPEEPAHGLSQREREVLTLLARGLSNRAIAETLVITEKTAEAHVSAILRKLDLASRAQVAAWVAEHTTWVTQAASPYHRF